MRNTLDFKRFFKNHTLLFLLIPLVILTQLILLAPHLKYGFSDVDWGFLSFYRVYKQKFPNPFINLINTFRDWGVYAHQSYYIGLQGELFGLNFHSFQLTTHIFKIIAILTTYPLFFVLSGSALLASLAVVLFSLAYPAVGTMYTVVTSSDYLAVIAMNIFLFVYWFVVKYNKMSLKWLFYALFLLLATLFLSTERMYPLLFIIFLIESFLYFRKESKKKLKETAKRLIVFYTPVIFVFLYKPIIFTNFLTRNGAQIVKRVAEGDWHVLLTPFISLGSMILPHNYWRFLGSFRLESFNGYFIYFLTGPFLIFLILTAILSYIISKRPITFFTRTLIPTALFSLAAYFLATHRKTHFDSAFIPPALIGFYLLGFSWSAFRRWHKTKEKLLIGLFAGPVLSFVYIFLTWVAAETFLIFTGTHRYLTVPAIGISFFIASLTTLIYRRFIKSSRIIVRGLSFIPFLLLIPLSVIWVNQINAFFSDQLNHGFGAEDQQHMRNQIRSYTSGLSSENPSLFYFDYSQDTKNGYYYDNTIFGGFKSWMLFDERINLDKELQPVILFEPPSGWKLLKDSIVVKNSEPLGFSVEEKYFSPADFYAFELKGKKVTSIKDDVLTKLGF